MRITALSLFSGCLGLDLGLEQAGITALAYVDKDERCLETIRRNKPGATVYNNVFDPEVIAFGRKHKVDLVVGGPPCQPFSIAGKRRFLEDDRGKTMLGFIEVVEKVSPRFFIMENVAGLCTKKAEPVLREIVSRFQAAGYTIKYEVLNTKDFGVPQSRPRLIMIGRKSEGEVQMPRPIPGIKTFRDATQNMPEVCEHRRYPKKLGSVMKHVPEGGNWKSLSPRRQKSAMGNANLKSGGLTAFYRRLSNDKPSPTLLTSPMQRATTLGHPTEDRPLSVQEYMRIQGFPDDWKIAGNTDDKYRQLGNAVPVLFGKAIGEAIVRMTR